MNVIISNKYTSMLKSLDIETNKTLEGVYDVDYIISTFSNFYYQRMILDITAIKNYNDITNLQKLSIAINMEKVILLLDDDGTGDDNNYLSNLISMGIYNFAKNKENILYLYSNPNSYRDVAHIHQLASNGVDNGVSVSNPGNMIIAGKDGSKGREDKSLSNNTKVETKYVDRVVTKVEEKIIHRETVVIGVKNVTEHAGATTFAYMMMCQLGQKYNVVALEVDKDEFKYYNTENMYSVESDKLPFEIMKHNRADAIIIDLNDTNNDELCTEVLYLMETSVLKLNKLIDTKHKPLEKIKDKKVVLNRCLLNNKDVLEFEYEAKIKTFFSMPPLDDRHNNIAMSMLLAKLGFNKCRVSGTIFDRFKL